MTGVQTCALPISISHKVTIVGMLDEVEATARHIGSVNTVVIDGGTLKGYNTDASGALRALEGAGVALDHERMVACRLERARQAREHPLPGVMNHRGLAVHDLLRVHDLTAIGLADSLMPETHAEDRDLAAETLDRIYANTGLVRRTRSWRDDDASRTELRDFVDADLVIGAVLIPGAKAPKLLSRSLVKIMKPGAALVDI